MKKLLLAILFAIICTSVYGQSPSPSDGFVIATGVGSTAEEAKQNAFIIAVEQSLGVLVSSDLLIENGELIKDRIKSNTQGLVESYTILSSVKDDDKYIVTVKAKVSKATIAQEIEQISHINSAKRSYDAVKCSVTYKNATWCVGGDIALFNMNYGIHADSYAVLRQYRGDIAETQLFFKLTLREQGYFYEVTDQNGDKLGLRHLDMGSQANRVGDKTATEDFIIVLDTDVITYLRKFTKSGLELKVKGSRKEVIINVPAAYIEGFVKFLDDKYKKQ